MPNLTGLELCRKIRSAKADHYTYIILCTSKGDKRDFIEGMEAGADDFLVKPGPGTEELRVRQSVRAKGYVVNLERGLALKNRELEGRWTTKLQQAYGRIEDDLKAAAWMQASLLPAASPNALGVKSEWRFRPSRYVAGDTLNIFPIDQNHVAFYLLDVSGHGVPAAMLSVTLSMLLTPDNTPGSPLKRFDAASQTYLTVPPEDAIADLNRRFQSRDDQYFYHDLRFAGDPQSHAAFQPGRPSKPPADSERMQDEGAWQRRVAGGDPAAGGIRLRPGSTRPR